MQEQEPNMSLEALGEFIRSKETEMKTGNSFNGSTLSDFQSRASQTGEDVSYSMVVFVNHLEETIEDFKIYDPYNFTKHPAPKSIPPHTQEIFTFVLPAIIPVKTSLSYVIPSARVRLAATSFADVRGAGLAFAPNEANMVTYYETQQGIEGSWVYEEAWSNRDKKLSVSYKNLRARMLVKNTGWKKATLRIELIELPTLD